MLLWHVLALLLEFGRAALVATTAVRGPSSSEDSYLTMTGSGARATALLSAGDAVTGLRFVGWPDG